MAEQPNCWSNDPFYSDDDISQKDEESTSVLRPGAEKPVVQQTSSKDSVPATSTAQLPEALNPIATQEPDKPLESANSSGPGGNTSQARHNGNSEWWAVILTSNERGIRESDVRVKEDTGTPVNWIHPNVVKRCKLDSEVEGCTPRFFKDMSGKEIKIEKRVKVTLVGRDKYSIEEVFFVSPARSPIDLVLGEKFVNKYGRAYEVCADEPKTQDARMFIAKKQTKEGKQKMKDNSETHKKLSAEVIARSTSGSSPKKTGGKKNGSSSEKKESSSKKVKER